MAEPQPVFEVRTRVTMRSLMNRTKHDLARQVLELLDLLQRERERREVAEALTRPPGPRTDPGPM